MSKLKNRPTNSFLYQHNKITLLEEWIIGRYVATIESRLEYGYEVLVVQYITALLHRTRNHQPKRPKSGLKYDRLDLPRIV